MFFRKARWFILCFLLLRCASPEPDQEEILFPVISVGGVIDEPEDFRLSQLVSEIEVIPLETHPDVLIDDDPWAMDAGDFFLVRKV